MADFNEKMTALADEIRALMGDTNAKSIDTMTSNIEAVNIEINRQTELLGQILSALEAKVGGSAAEARLEGDGQTFFSVLPKELTFRSEADVNTLQEVVINGETLDPSNYTVTEGSTIITLHKDFLAALLPNTYNIAVVSELGSAIADFDVTDNITYTDGDYTYTIKQDGFETLEEARRYYKAFCSVWYEDSWQQTVDSFNGDEEQALDYFDSATLKVGLTQDAFVAKENPPMIWTVVANNKDKEAYGEIKKEIFGIPVSDMTKTFQNCVNLINAPTIPDSMLHIGLSAFNGCSGLRSISLPNGVISIGNYAFQGCSNLTDINLPNSLVNIETRAFSGTGLIRLTIPEGITTIPSYVTCDCPALTEIVIPSTVEEITHYAFSGCTQLSAIKFQGTLSQWNQISRGAGWNSGCGTITITCTDGVTTATDTSGPSGPSLPT